MKIASIIIDTESASTNYLKKYLQERFPEINIRGEASDFSEANRLIQDIHPELVFCDQNIMPNNSLLSLRGKIRSDFETIMISKKAEDAVCAFRQDACGFLLKPLNVSDIIFSVGHAIQKISRKGSWDPELQAVKLNQSSYSNLIGIPSMEGFEFLYDAEIVRCEGLQKCTRVITVREGDIVSSYNIGEFRKILDSYGFFLCHKSHLINLTHVRRLTREGFIYLTDNTPVPLARRKRQEFLSNLKHL